MEHIMLTLFLCFVAFAAVGQAAYVCPRRENAEKLYAPPGRMPCAASSSNNASTNALKLVMVSGGLEEDEDRKEQGSGIQRAA